MDFAALNEWRRKEIISPATEEKAAAESDLLSYSQGKGTNLVRGETPSHCIISFPNLPHPDPTCLQFGCRLCPPRITHVSFRHCDLFAE